VSHPPVVVSLLVVTISAVGGPGDAPDAGQGWQQSFDVALADLRTTGANDYFLLEPGRQSTFRGKERGQAAELVITVLDETKKVGGVETRVVEERETVGGEIIEISRNFFAISPAGDVYYFGEDVDAYAHGRIKSHEGSWQHGTNGARFGLMMPAAPKVGMKFYQEQAKGVAMDRAEIVSLTDRLTVPAGTFDRCLKTRETTPLEKLAREYKIYAPGVGLIKDGSLELVSQAAVLR
jgi:hypothetical protein